MQQPDPNNNNNGRPDDCIAYRTRARTRAAAANASVPTNRSAADPGGAAPAAAPSRPTTRATRSGGGGGGGGGERLTQEQIDQIPGYKYEVPKCAICLDVFHDADLIRTLRCMHEFHSVCLVTWLGTHTTCPMCRRKVAVDRNAANDLQRAAAS